MELKEKLLSSFMAFEEQIDVHSELHDVRTTAIKNFEDKITISKNDILEVTDLKNCTKEYFVFNGGGLVSGSNHKIELKSINKKDIKNIYI